MDPALRSVSNCPGPGPSPVTASGNITDATAYLKEAMLSLEPGTQWGGDFADKPGYHNKRQNLPSYDYSVCDRPPDDGGSSAVASAVDWTFPEAHSGDYSRISKYTKRLLASAQDPADTRLDGWREFYGQADVDTYVEGWDMRYGYAVTSDSSHLWHIHISENRDQTASYDNKDRLLSVLRGETFEEWDMSAKDVWNYDVDPSSKSYTAAGSLWTVYGRTAYLANDFAPMVTEALTQLTNAQMDTDARIGVLARTVDELICLIRDEREG